jgi:hypothetical protein
MEVELEHGARGPATDITGDDPILTGKIALAHLNEFSDYYTRLKRIEDEADRAWRQDIGRPTARALHPLPHRCRGADEDRLGMRGKGARPDAPFPPRSRRWTTRAGSCHLASPSPSGTPTPARSGASSQSRPAAPASTLECRKWLAQSPRMDSRVSTGGVAAPSAKQSSARRPQHGS